MRRERRRLSEEQFLIDRHNSRWQFMADRTQMLAKSGKDIFLSIAGREPTPITIEAVAAAFTSEIAEEVKGGLLIARFALLFLDEPSEPCLEYGWLVQIDEGTESGVTAVSLALSSGMTIPIYSNTPEIFSLRATAPGLTSSTHRVRSGSRKLSELHFGRMGIPSGYRPVENWILFWTLLSGPLVAGEMISDP